MSMAFATQEDTTLHKHTTHSLALATYYLAPRRLRC